MMHIGSYNDEPATVAMMDAYIKASGHENDITDERQHHEISLSDPRKTLPEKMKTVIRHPIKVAANYYSLPTKKNATAVGIV